MCVSYIGTPDIVELLVEARADTTQSDSLGLTALMTAVSRGFVDVVRVLLSTPHPHVLATDNEGRSALKHAERYPAIKMILQDYLDHESLVWNVHNGYVLSLFSLSFVLLRRIYMFTSFISYFETYVRAQDQDQLQSLLSRKASLEERDQNGLTPLQLAVQHSLSPTISLLVAAKANLEARAPAQQSASCLALACVEGNNAIVQALLMAGAEVGSKNDQGDTSIMLAARHGHLDTVKLLINHVRACTKYGSLSRSKRFRASCMTELGITSSLSSPSSAKSSRMQSQKSAGGVARMGLAGLELDSDSDLDSDEEIFAGPGVSALEELKLTGKAPGSSGGTKNNGGLDMSDWENLTEGEWCVRELVRDVNARHRDVLQVTCETTYNKENGLDTTEELFQLLIDSKASLNHRDRDGSTALMIASEHGHIQVINIHHYVQHVYVLTLK